DNAAGTVTLTFNSLTDVKTKVGEADRTHAKKITITAFFLDNRGTKKKVDLVVRVQNAPVGCSVRRVDDPEKTNPAINGWLTFMCYNLGADPDKGDPAEQKTYVPSPNTGSSTDRTVYGDIYQWGRIGDGHQRRDLSIENIWPLDHLGQTTGIEDDPVPNAAANINMTTGQVLETDARFGKFIRRTQNNYDWIAGTETTGIYNNRWNIGTEAVPEKAPADPCPAGWRVPTRTEWASIYGAATDCTTGDCYGNAKVNKWVHNFGESGTHGVSLTPSATNGSNTDFGTYPTFFLPASGCRSHEHGNVVGSGTSTLYWSSSVVASSIAAYRPSWASTHVRPSAANGRSGGNSVRCVSE
ncbi:MAG: hypothetical protein LBH61_06715, partial [Dysgonamonadaceae bacterium]|nr:hypothetical protein [Dysgonamonadaceae bacterium]